MKRHTVTIGIPAYNEEGNIKNLLTSLIRQKEKGFQIERIIVVSDKSNDKTAILAKEVKDKRIRVVKNNERVGKSVILNRLFQKNESDIIILFDADVLAYSDNAVSNIIKPLLNDTNVGLVGGNLLPLEPESFIDEAVNLTRQAFRDARLKWKSGHNIYGCEGGLLALSKEFADKVIVPSDMIANDRFLYFSCITLGFEFRHVLSAKAWYKLPTSLRDHVKQSSRFIAAQFRLSRLFPKIAAREHALPKKQIIKDLMKKALRKPFHVSFIILLNRYCEFIARKMEAKMNAKWPMADSTKVGLQK